MTEREKMLAGELYDCGDKELFDPVAQSKKSDPGLQQYRF